MVQQALDLEGHPDGDRSVLTYSVSGLAEAINDNLRSGFGSGVWVRGEITGFNDRNKHTYFTLADADGAAGASKAVLNISLFAHTRSQLTPVLQRSRLELADGMKVRIFGNLGFYAPSGRISLTMSAIDPQFTLGEISLARDQLLGRLAADGLLDANRRHPISPVPLRVGVVASKGSAAWADFHGKLVESGFGFRLSLIDSRVQGEEAIAMVASAIRTLGSLDGLDCVVVIRGGGAKNDLAAFDAEAIALAIAASPLPVLTGIGHEVDRSIADEVAHTALMTPTACAQFLIDAVGSYLISVDATWSLIDEAARRKLLATSVQLSERAHRIALRTHAAVERSDGRLGTRIDRLRQLPYQRLSSAQAAVDSLRSRVTRVVPQVLVAEQRSIDGAEARLALLDPVNLLRRGWSITRDAHGALVRSTGSAKHGSIISTRVADGILTSRVEDPTEI